MQAGMFGSGMQIFKQASMQAVMQAWIRYKTVILAGMQAGVQVV